MEVSLHLFGFRTIGFGIFTFFQPQSQSMGGLKPVFFHSSQLQTGTHDLDFPQVWHVSR